MKPTFFGANLPCWAGLGLLLFACSGQAKVDSSHDSEDSPLYVASRQNAYAEMSKRDHLPPATGADAGAGTILVVGGTKWNRLPAAGSDLRPRPLDVTTDTSCSFPTMCTSCTPTSCAADASCGSAPTCRGYLSCHVPMPTCYNFSCGPGPTCSGSITCQGYPTCDLGSCGAGLTCTTMPTCGGSPTCAPSPTCAGTCVPANCQVAITNVSVPQVGQIQLSFISSAQLQYVLQYCTNLVTGSWMEACLTNGNGDVLTLCHTNGAQHSLYRLLIQSH